MRPGHVYMYIYGFEQDFLNSNFLRHTNPQKKKKKKKKKALTKTQSYKIPPLSRECKITVLARVL